MSVLERHFFLIAVLLPPEHSEDMSSSGRKALAEAFELVSRQRYTCRSFQPQLPIPAPVLRRIVELAQMAPTSFNLQPYKLLLVRGEEGKDKLASAMMGNNAKMIQEASASVVFLADIDPARNVEALMQLERDNGTDRAYIASLPNKLTFLLGTGRLAKGIKKVASHLLSPLQPMPVIDMDNQAWAAKNVGLVAQQLMLASTAYGLVSAPMEGFDERRLQYQLRIPEARYHVPLVISMGYEVGTSAADTLSEAVNSTNSSTFSSRSSGNKQSISPKKVRFSLEAVCYEDEFGRHVSF